MITIDHVADLPGEIHLEIAAPLTVADIERVETVFRERTPGGPKLRLLMIVDSIGLSGPRALWEDLKLTPHLRDIERTAVLTDLNWYGTLAQVAGTLLPGIEIKHFEPGQRDAALAWLRSPPAR